MSVEHATFVVRRTYPAPRVRVFAAWADPQLKARWFCEPGGHHELDFRVGGTELNRDGTPGGPGYTSIASYREIVPNERIIYTYELHAGDALASVSLTTVTFGRRRGPGHGADSDRADRRARRARHRRRPRARHASAGRPPGGADRQGEPIEAV